MAPGQGGGGSWRSGWIPYADPKHGDGLGRALQGARGHSSTLLEEPDDTVRTCHDSADCDMEVCLDQRERRVPGTMPDISHRNPVPQRPALMSGGLLSSLLGVRPEVLAGRLKSEAFNCPPGGDNSNSDGQLGVFAFLRFGGSDGFTSRSLAGSYRYGCR